MKNEFVNYNQALKLKELEFDEPCFGYYDLNGLQVNTHHWYPQNKNSSFPLPHTTNNPKISAPTFSQAFRWFREKYGLFIQPNRTIDSEGTWYYFSIASKRTDVCEGSFVYEEAELACLNKLIEIVESKSE